MGVVTQCVITCIIATMVHVHAYTLELGNSIDIFTIVIFFQVLRYNSKIWTIANLQLENLTLYVLHR